MDSRLGCYNISVHPTRINYYYESFNPRSRVTTKFTSNEEVIDFLEKGSKSGNPVASKKPAQFQDNYHHGKISKTAERKINRAIDYMLFLAKPKRLPHTKHGKGLSFRLNFVTLTLSSEQIHTDHEIMSRVFSPFLNSLRQKWHVSNYIWRAERQGSGGIHYHVITDKWIPWSELRDVWNRHQESLGYVSRYRQNQQLWHRDGFRPRPDLYQKWPLSKQKKAYEEGCRHDWNSPNSSDVHSLRLVFNVRAYFKKYMTKEGQNSDIKGRLWGCSERLSCIQGGRAAVYSKIDDDLARIQNDKTVKSYSSEYFTTIYITPADLRRLGCMEILSVFEEFLSQKFPDYYPPKLPGL